MMRSQCAYLRVSCFHSKQISEKLNLSENNNDCYSVKQRGPNTQKFQKNAIY